MQRKTFYLTKEIVREIKNEAKRDGEKESEIARRAFYKYFPKI